MRNEPISTPSFRKALIKIHNDLFQIVDHAADFDWEEITDLEKILLALEDKRFFSHCGFDAIASVREMTKALMFRKHGGASTIDMQFVRTVTGFREKRLRRKLYEILLSFLLQFRLSKKSILKSYLRCAYFGSGVYGSEAASRIVFGKHLSELTLDESAFIAAMLVYPRPLNPSERWYGIVQKRADYGIRRSTRLKKRFKQLPC